MARTPRTPQQNAAITRRAINSFKQWNDERTPLHDSNGVIYKFSMDERIVPLYDYLQHRLKKRYYVTENGIILSFQNPDAPIVLTQSFYEGYMVFSGSDNSFNTHRAVWYSFAYYCLVNNLPLPDHFGISIETIADLNAIPNSFQVHHKNTRSTCNELSNLRLMERPFNILLRDMANTSKDKMDVFNESLSKIEKAANGIAAGVVEKISPTGYEIDIHTMPNAPAVVNDYLNSEVRRLFNIGIVSLANKFGEEIYNDQFNVAIVIDKFFYHFLYQDKKGILQKFDQNKIDVWITDEKVIIENNAIFKKYLQK